MRSIINPFKSVSSRSVMILCAALALPLSVTACGKQAADAAKIEKLDEALIGKGSDPAMNVAVQDRILIDPNLTDSANINAVKAPDMPLNGALPSDTGSDDISRAGTTASFEELNSSKMMRAPKPTVIAAEDCKSCGDNRPVTLGAMAEEQGVKRGKGTCDAKLQYGATWATRMPPEFPIYPAGRVQEAGGVDGGICDIRVASFNTNAAMQDVVDYYYTRAKRSGFSADYEIRGGEHVLGGTRDSDGGAYVITLNRFAGGGTSVDIVANNGR